MDYKTIIGIVAVSLTFVGYAPYVRDIVRRKTTPHMFTWLVWLLSDSIAAGLQLFGGAGVGAWPTVAVSVFCLGIFILSWRYGSKDIAKSDVCFLLLALTALVLWLVVKQPVLSIILIVFTDVAGLGPTVRKSWSKPYSETLSTYQISSARYILSIFALRQFNILTLLYPAVWAVVMTSFSVMLVVRRKIVKELS